MVTERFFERILSWYSHSLHWVLDHAFLTLTVLFLTVALNVAIIIKIPKGFFPRLEDIYFHTKGSSSLTATGNSPLATMTTYQANTTPLTLNHTGLFPSVTVSFNLAPGASLSDATVAIDQLKQKMGVPSTIRGFFAGTLQAYQQSLSTEPILVLTALLAVYIVLGVLYESLVHPRSQLPTPAQVSQKVSKTAIESPQ